MMTEDLDVVAWKMLLTIRLNGSLGIGIRLGAEFSLHVNLVTDCHNLFLPSERQRGEKKICSNERFSLISSTTTVAHP